MHITNLHRLYGLANEIGAEDGAGGGAPSDGGALPPDELDPATSHGDDMFGAPEDQPQEDAPPADEGATEEGHGQEEEAPPGNTAEQEPAPPAQQQPPQKPAAPTEIQQALTAVQDVIKRMEQREAANQQRYEQLRTAWETQQQQRAKQEAMARARADLEAQIQAAMPKEPNANAPVSAYPEYVRAFTQWQTNAMRARQEFEGQQQAEPLQQRIQEMERQINDFQAQQAARQVEDSIDRDLAALRQMPEAAPIFGNQKLFASFITHWQSLNTNSQNGRAVNGAAAFADWLGAMREASSLFASQMKARNAAPGGQRQAPQQRPAGATPSRAAPRTGPAGRGGPRSNGLPAARDWTDDIKIG